MTRRLWVAPFLVFAATSAGFAQVVVVPPPMLVPVPVVVVPGGLAVTYQRRNLAITAFYPFASGALVTGSPIGSYGVPVVGVVERRITVVNIVAGRPAQAEVDLGGVDLDIVGPEALQPGFRPELAKKQEPRASKSSRKRKLPYPLRRCPGYRPPKKIPRRP